MDHRDIEEHQIVSRYLVGKLAADERARFEDHFVDCPQCLEQLEATEDLRGALQGVAAAHGALARPRYGGWLDPIFSWRSAMAIAATLLVALPAVWLLARGRVQLERAKSAEWRTRYQREQLRSDELRRRLEESEGKYAAGASLASAAPVFSLTLSRGAAGEETEPVNRIVLSATPRWIVLTLEREQTAEFRAYRARLEGAGGRAVVTVDPLQPASREAFGLSLHSSLLDEGRYVVILEGLAPSGHYVGVARFPFSVSTHK